ncbi:glycosyltransferase [Flaviaesturariibacter flavus]|uniref:Glycosyltransferase n=1 Tax=Flaviaesturariibacter flavus TaxID=2502780 RepID=A0A4R1B939_9BACT|nr:glycosyltransferase [Flaviaesturariibacter flavus]TCJ13103.1 glycosyltransferase [Flaviaesturariibacter flavus]
MQGISVVIPNYNGVGLFPHTLPTVFEALAGLTLPWELIVVDDCSTDDSVTWLQAHYPQIILLRNAVNSGFSVTVNNGVRAAQYDLVLLLNSDVKLTPGYFAPQLRYFDDPQTFGVMGRIVGWDDDIVQDGAKYPYFHGVKIKTSGNYLPESEDERRGGLLSMYLSGANALVRRELYWKVGGLNELFSPFYVEDFELSLRAWRMGFLCWYEYDAVCRHRVSTTIRTGARKRFVEIVYNRNKMLLHALHLPRGARYVYFLQLLLETLARLLTGRWSFVQSLGQLLGRYGRVRQARAKFLQNGNSTRLLSVREAADRVLQFIKHKKIKKF